MPIHWSRETELKLLLTIIDNSGGRLASWGKVAEIMGYGFTVASVRQHYAALKKENEASSGKPPNSANNSTEPLKRKRNAMKRVSSEEDRSPRNPPKSTNDSPKPPKRKRTAMKSETSDDTTTIKEGNGVRRRLFSHLLSETTSSASPNEAEETIDEDSEI